MPWFLGNTHMWQGSFFWPGFIAPLVIWSSICTGFALWYAAKRNEKGWFIFFLFVHTAGIVELIYLLFVAHVMSSETKKQTKKRTSV